MSSTRVGLLGVLAGICLAVSPLSADTLFLATEDLTSENFPEAAERLREDIARPKGPYSRLTSTQAQRVNRFLDRISEALASDSPSAGNRIRRYQASINKILTPSVPTSNTTEYVCRREKAHGSHIHETKCYDRQALDEGSREAQHRLMMEPEFRRTD